MQCCCADHLDSSGSGANPIQPQLSARSQGCATGSSLPARISCPHRGYMHHGIYVGRGIVADLRVRRISTADALSQTRVSQILDSRFTGFKATRKAEPHLTRMHLPSPNRVAERPGPHAGQAVPWRFAWILEVHARRDSKRTRRFGRELLAVGDGL